MASTELRSLRYSGSGQGPSPNWPTREQGSQRRDFGPGRLVEPHECLLSPRRWVYTEQGRPRTYQCKAIAIRFSLLRGSTRRAGPTVQNRLKPSGDLIVQQSRFPTDPLDSADPVDSVSSLFSGTKTRFFRVTPTKRLFQRPEHGRFDSTGTKHVVVCKWPVKRLCFGSKLQLQLLSRSRSLGEFQTLW